MPTGIWIDTYVVKRILIEKGAGYPRQSRRRPFDHH